MIAIITICVVFIALCQLSIQHNASATAKEARRSREAMEEFLDWLKKHIQ